MNPKDRDQLHRIIDPSYASKEHLEADGWQADLQWSRILAPYLQGVLAYHGDYTPNQVQQHVQFFVHHVVPWLGLGPEHDAASMNAPIGLYCPRYKSSMTNDYTPFELSCCWRNYDQRGKPIVRYVVDIAPSFPESCRSTSFENAIKAIETLRTIASDTNGHTSRLDIFPDLWTHITSTIMHYELDLHQSSCPICSPSTTFVGFDLVGSHTKVKFYWLLPSCQASSKLLVMLDHVFHSSSAINLEFASPAFVDAWHTVRDYIASYPDTLRPRMLSVDATRHPFPRVKFYTRCVLSTSKDSDAFESHLSLGGKVTLPEHFVSTCRDVWRSLIASPRGADSDKPAYCLLFYEIGAAAATETIGLSSKLYIMCGEIPRRDSFIASQLLDHCRILDGAPLLQAFADHADPTAFVAEIGLAPKKDDTEVAVYLNPSCFSSHSWVDGEDAGGLFPRIRSIVSTTS